MFSPRDTREGDVVCPIVGGTISSTLRHPKYENWKMRSGFYFWDKMLYKVLVSGCLGHEVLTIWN